MSDSMPQAVADALAWVAKLSSSIAFESYPEGLATAAARVLAAEVERLRQVVGAVDVTERIAGDDGA